MRLSESRQGDVVKNCRNHSFYRYEKPESNRTRIRPLELFPNGLLIEKSADTIVESSLEVNLVGRWSHEFFVDEPAAERLRSSYHTEWRRKQEELVVLEAEMLTIDPKSRGSHANKVKAVARRVRSLEMGLAERSKDATVIASIANSIGPLWRARDFVQLPSGLPAIVIGARDSLIEICTKTPQGRIVVQLQSDCLRPLEHRNLATI
jgi:hypothetical protein